MLVLLVIFFSPNKWHGLWFHGDIGIVIQMVNIVVTTDRVIDNNETKALRIISNDSVDFNLYIEFN